jgi:hypothetical protein
MNAALENAIFRVQKELMPLGVHVARVEYGVSMLGVVMPGYIASSNAPTYQWTLMLCAAPGSKPFFHITVGDATLDGAIAKAVEQLNSLRLQETAVPA